MGPIEMPFHTWKYTWSAAQLRVRENAHRYRCRPAGMRCDMVAVYNISRLISSVASSSASICCSLAASCFAASVASRSWVSFWKNFVMSVGFSHSIMPVAAASSLRAWPCCAALPRTPQMTAMLRRLFRTGECKH